MTLKSANTLKGNAPVAKSVAAVNLLLEGPMTQAEFNDPAYSFQVYVVPKVVNNVKKADQAVIYSPVGSDVEVAIKLVERPKYRMKEAIKKMLDDHDLAVSNYDFQKAWKANDLKNPAKGRRWCTSRPFSRQTMTLSAYSHRRCAVGRLIPNR